jgi:hypothetical protein
VVLDDDSDFIMMSASVALGVPMALRFED